MELARPRRSTLRRAGVRLLALALPALTACEGQPSEEPEPEPERFPVELELVADGLSDPTYLAQPPGDDRLFVLEQSGRVRIIRDGTVLEAPFLDITAEVRSGGERGMLGLEFAPDFGTSGLFFVHYSGTDGSTRLASYVAPDAGDTADPASAILLLEHEQPFANHNGGQIEIGPDGMLYMGLGDGGGDARDNAQELSTMLGSILRLDVSDPSRYTVPSDNPFVDSPDAEPEIWHYGLRNPWRFSFSSNPPLLLIADVGELDIEEIDAVDTGTAGLNFGWPIMEGSECFEAEECDREGLTTPVSEYAHPEGCSVTGGYLYEGSAIRELQGRYVYSDYCEGWLRTFLVGLDGSASDPATLPISSPGSVTSFGEGDDGELYVLTHEGSVYKLVPKR